MNADDLQEELLNEVPMPAGDYWDRINDVLTSTDVPLAKTLATADAGRADDDRADDDRADDDDGSGDDTGDHDLGTGTVADITVASATRQPGRTRRPAWRWPAVAAAAALLVFGGWFVGNRQPRVSTPVDLAAQPGDSQPGQAPGAQGDTSAESPRANLDHWHAVYAVWDCTADSGSGAWVPPFQSEADDYGIHSHGDGLVAIHPFFESSAGANAKFGLFAESMGIDVSVDGITLDDGRRLEAGTSCGGESAVVQLQRWQYDFLLREDPTLAPTVITSDFNDERFFNDREVWVLALAPLDADLPPIPTDRWDALDSWRAPTNPMDIDDDLPRRSLTPPEADSYLPAIAGIGGGVLAEQLLAIRQEHNALGDLVEYEPVEPGSVTHVASVQTASRTLDLFRVERERFPYCARIFSNSSARPGSMQGCGDHTSGPRLDVITGNSLTSAAAIGTPPEARWMMIELDDGIRIVTDVIDGMAYAEWVAFGATPISITLLDDTQALIFTYDNF